MTWELKVCVAPKSSSTHSVLLELWHFISHDEEKSGTVPSQNLSVLVSHRGKKKKKVDTFAPTSWFCWNSSRSHRAFADLRARLQRPPPRELRGNRRAETNRGARFRRASRRDATNGMSAASRAAALGERQGGSVGARPPPLWKKCHWFRVPPASRLLMGTCSTPRGWVGARGGRERPRPRDGEPQQRTQPRSDSAVSRNCAKEVELLRTN